MTRYMIAATDEHGRLLGAQSASTAPTLTEVAQVGDDSGTNYVSVLDDRDLVTVYGRDAHGAWSAIAADVDEETAEEARLWFDVTQHYGFRSQPDTDGHPLDDVSMPNDDDRLSAILAIQLVVDRIQARGLDYPLHGLIADRFNAGWNVYAPVDVDDSDPMAFLDIPVGRSYFLVSDAGRVKETSTSIPPVIAERMFAAEEAFVHRPLAGESTMVDLWTTLTSLDAASDGSSGIASFTVDTPPR